MSSMIHQPAPSIQIGGPQGAPGQAGPGPLQGPGPAGGGPGSQVDPAAVKQNLQKAYQALMAAASAEGHDPDGAQYTQLAAKVHSLIAASTSLEDDVMGAGPGVKMIRKTANGGAAGGAGGGY